MNEFELNLNSESESEAKSEQFQITPGIRQTDHQTEIKCVCTGRLWSDVIFHNSFKLGSEVRTNLK